MSKSTIAQNLKLLTDEAKGLLVELDEIGRDLERKLTRALDRAWRLGVVLASIKTTIGHGNWLVWLEANLPLSPRHAQRHMELAGSNPEARSVNELSVESVRKFRLGYVPGKERPQLAGDVTLPRVCHHLTLRNDWSRLLRKIEIGEVKLDKDEARRDLAPLFAWLCDLYGINGENPTAQ